MYILAFEFNIVVFGNSLEILLNCNVWIIYIFVCRPYLPKFGTDLISTLPALDMEDFSHGIVVILITNMQKIKREPCKCLGMQGPLKQKRQFWAIEEQIDKVGSKKNPRG